jgi:O-antigen ligase
LEAAHKSRWTTLSSLFFLATRSWFWLLCADIYPALVAACVPWTTTGVATFMIVWIFVLIPTLSPTQFLRSLNRPASSLPLAFFALAAIGMLWADGPWLFRFHGLGPVTKLLAIPLLLYHFERSQRGRWVFLAFLVSCTLLLGLSWISLFAADWKITATETAGVPVKNYIDQSQEFGFCILALTALILTFFDQRRFALAVLCAVLMLSFFASMMFVASSRTALVFMPILLILFAIRHLNRGMIMLLFTGTAAVATLIWFTSPYLRQRVEHVAVEYREYNEINRPTSTGLRLEYWKASLKSISGAPLFGHGTGSTKQLFDRKAAGKIGAWANSITNPHNQTLYVAVQWGALGCIVLYVMWGFHILLFSEKNLVGWIGLIVVVQNIVSSLFNSHLFDFSEGWMYVLGVGVAGGVSAKIRKAHNSVPSPLLKPGDPSDLVYRTTAQ